jgi:ferritin-like metal-binding protein YciE
MMLNNYTNTNGPANSYSYGNEILASLGSKPKQDSLFLIRRTFIQELKAIYWAEKRLHRLLPRLQRSGSVKSLVQTFRTHYMQSVEHLSRIGQIFMLMEEKPSGKRCHLMVNIMNDAAKVIRSTKKHTPERDMSLVLIAQRVEQYEIQKYSTLLRLSTLLEEYEITSLIELTLTEEREAEETFLAIKREAMSGNFFQPVFNALYPGASEEE